MEEKEKGLRIPLGLQHEWHRNRFKNTELEGWGTVIDNIVKTSKEKNDFRVQTKLSCGFSSTLITFMIYMTSITQTPLCKISLNLYRSSTKLSYVEGNSNTFPQIWPMGLLSKPVNWLNVTLIAFIEITLDPVQYLKNLFSVFKSSDLIYLLKCTPIVCSFGVHAGGNCNMAMTFLGEGCISS